jgi:mRNA-degrading endonuclease RelE of RelBE toxin-antitoxin system
VAYEIVFSDDARAHLSGFAAGQRRIILGRVGALLASEPARETRNLKVLRPNPLSKYELRIGAFRVFFEVDQESNKVLVLAVGRKEGNRLTIAGKVVML